MDNLLLNNQQNPCARAGAGSYQTMEGDWRRAAKMRFDGS
jgi:hypothetical protein